MNKITLRQTLIPLITIAIICFLWFGPINLSFLPNIIASIVIIIANYIEYKRKVFSELGFQREKFTTKNILVLAPLAALGLFIFYFFALVPVITKLTGVPIDYSSFDELKAPKASNPPITRINIKNALFKNFFTFYPLIS